MIVFLSKIELSSSHFSCYFSKVLIIHTWNVFAFQSLQRTPGLPTNQPLIFRKFFGFGSLLNYGVMVSPRIPTIIYIIYGEKIHNLHILHYVSAS